jgi:hypothetical protein
MGSGEMNRDDIIRMAGHREVPAWVMKLVMDCIEAEREHGSLSLTVKNVHRLCKYVGEVEYKDGEICENDN